MTNPAPGQLRGPVSPSIIRRGLTEFTTPTTDAARIRDSTQMIDEK
jgi:hypothetical protein